MDFIGTLDIKNAGNVLKTSQKTAKTVIIMMAVENVEQVEFHKLMVQRVLTSLIIVKIHCLNYSQLVLEFELILMVVNHIIVRIVLTDIIGMDISAMIVTSKTAKCVKMMRLVKFVRMGT